MSPRSYKKKVAKSVLKHWVSILFPSHPVGVAGFLPKAGYVTNYKGNILLSMLRVESKCELKIDFYRISADNLTVA